MAWNLDQRLAEEMAEGKLTLEDAVDIRAMWVKLGWDIQVGTPAPGTPVPVPIQPRPKRMNPVLRCIYGTPLKDRKPR